VMALNRVSARPGRWFPTNRKGPCCEQQETDPTLPRAREETDMTPTAPTRGRVSGRLRLAVAGAVVATVLTAATAAAVAPP
jgi:hypothetical protein